MSKDQIAQFIRDSFARQGLMQTFDARIDEIAHGRVTLSLPITPEVGQQHGFAPAGASFALGASAPRYAALTMMEPGSEVLTVEMKINLIAPAKGKRLMATGVVLRPGRRLIVVRATVAAEAAGTTTEVALLQGTMIRA